MLQSFEQEDAELAWIEFKWTQTTERLHTTPSTPCNTPTSLEESPKVHSSLPKANIFHNRKTVCDTLRGFCCSVCVYACA